MPRLADVIAGFAFPPCHRHAAQKVTFDISNVFVSDPFKGSPQGSDPSHLGRSNKATVW